MLLYLYTLRPFSHSPLKIVSFLFYRYGEEFDIQKHPQGTEVKAITYSNMQIYDEEDRHEVFVIIDI